MADSAISRQEYNQLVVREYMRMRTKKISIIFISILTAGMAVLAPVLYFLIHNIPAAIAAVIGVMVSVSCLILSLKNKTKLGSGILLGFTINVLLYVMYARLHLGNDYAPMLLTIIGLTFVLLTPSGILVHRLFTLILTIYFYCGFAAIILIRKEAILIQKLPLIFIVYALFTSILYYIIYLQDMLLIKIIDEKNNSDESLHKAKQIVEQVSRFKREYDESQENVSQQLSEISKNIRNYSTKIDDISRSSDDISTQINQSQTNLNTLSGSIHEITGKIDNQSGYITKNTSIQENVFALITSLIHKSKDTSQLNTALLESSNKATKLSDEAETTISELNIYRKKMEDIVKMITTVSAQTNMLAMNAYIEAAHAGDKGAGFAVVAEEVRKLADQTNTNARKINEIIKEMNGRINDSVSMVHKIFEILQEIAGQSSNMDEIVNQITAVIENLMKHHDSLQNTNNELTSITGFVTGESSHQLTIVTTFSETFNTLLSYFNNLSSQIGDLLSINTNSLGSLNTISGIKEKNKSLNKAINDMLDNF